MYERILVPLDGSEFAEAVLRHVRALAECTGAEIILLRVVVYPPAIYPVPYEYPILDPVLAAAVREKEEVVRLEVRDYLQYIAASLEEAGLSVLIEVRDEPVVDAILDVAESLRADLIAMSTHGDSGTVHRFIGAVADRVVHNAKVPVLLIRPALTDPAFSSHIVDVMVIDW